jgi:hypothetical protein
MSSLNNIDKKYNIVIYASFIILAIGLIYVMNKQNNLSSLITTGPGSNTAKIPSSSGLYYYNPAICYLYAKSLTTDGWIQWDILDQNNVPMKGFTIGNNDGQGPNTAIIPDVFGHYEITISGTVSTNSTGLFLAMNNINVHYRNLLYQEIPPLPSAPNTYPLVAISATAFARPYTTNNLSGFVFKLAGATLWSGDGANPLFACVKYIGS